MDRPAKIACLTLLLVPAISIAQPGANAARAETVIYKHVDENGRVTYANSPIKGGARVDLEPLTVIPSTPGGSLNAANAQTVSRIVAPPTATVSALPAAPAKPAIQVASVLPLSNHVQAAKPSPAAPANTVVASAETLTQIVEQRRAETRRQLLEGEFQTEEQLLVAARSKLEEEQRTSGSIRAMRASFAATAGTATAQKPLISPETRAEIERHFERVRNLQDQVAMHEDHLQTLRGQLGAVK